MTVNVGEYNASFGWHRPWAHVAQHRRRVLYPHSPFVLVAYGRAGIVPFRCSPDLLGGKGTSHVGWDTGDLPCQGKNYGDRSPPGPCVPLGGTPAAPVPPPLSGWRALFSAGAWHRRRRVVYQIAPAKNPSWRSGGAHELGGAPAEKLNGMIIIRMSESSFKLIFLASLFSAYLRRRYSLILSLFFSKYSCFCNHTIEGLSCFHCLEYSFILSLFSS